MVNCYCILLRCFIVKKMLACHTKSGKFGTAVISTVVVIVVVYTLPVRTHERTDLPESLSTARALPGPVDG